MKTILHFTPAQGWLNDPNGLIDHGGLHHLFFQHNPHEMVMSDMCWGHATSPDLLTWTEHPVALAPGPVGSYDHEGCWSGCAVRDEKGVAVIYSGNNDGIQLPCLARPLDDDLITWEKSTSNPIIAYRPPVDDITDMRDHSVRRDGEQWRQVLAAGAAGEGMLFGYSSPDLVDWSWDGVILRASDAGLPGRVWECPDVFEDGDHVVAIMSAWDGNRHPVMWVTGTLDGPRILPERFGLVDHGDRFYAPQSYLDRSGRRIMFGWLKTQDDKAALGQASLGVMSLPRTLSVVDGRLHQQPAAEIASRRGEAERFAIASGDVALSLSVEPVTALELRLICESADDLDDLSIELSDDEDHRTTVELTVFSSSGQLRRRDDQLSEVNEAHQATLFFDAGIVEIFLDDGRAAALSDARVECVTTIRVSRTGEGPVDVTVWPLTNAR